MAKRRDKRTFTAADASARRRSVRANNAVGRRTDGGVPEMERLRRTIDGIDGDLLRLLNDRAGCALAVGSIKRRLGLPIYSAEREREILSRISQLNPGPLEEAAVRRLFERIIDESRRLERLAVQEVQAPEKPERE